MATMTTVDVSLEQDCGPEECATFAGPLHRQLADGRYDLCSVMAIPASVDGWRAEHRTARKRADRATRRGYRFTPVARHERADEIFAINTSAPHRQGRPMSAAYMAPVQPSPDPSYACPRHGVHPYGVEAADGTLVAYLWLYRAGQLALVSQILGHADHLENEVMYLLWQGLVEHEWRTSPGPFTGYLVYNRHDSGTDGLRFYKERVGLTETKVRWLP